MPNLFYTHNLLGKYFTDSTPPSYEETMTSLLRQWNLSGTIYTSKVGDMFFFFFSEEKDQTKILLHKYYYVNGVIIVFKEPTSDDVFDWFETQPPLSYEFVLMKSPDNNIREFENTLTYPQFFIELEFKNNYVSNFRSMSETKATHRFRFPCSYLNEATDSIDSAYEVLNREIYENLPFGLDEFGDKSKEIESLVEEIKNNHFCLDDMLFPLKLQINRISKLTPTDYETMLVVHRDKVITQEIEKKISDLIRTKVENDDDLLDFSSWENQIGEFILKVGGLNHYTELYDVSKRAYEAIEEAVMMEISSESCPIPADKTAFSCFKRFKVDGSDMDRLDQCVICSEEMFLGEEATSLPCSHVFHRFCIEKWFHVGHKCPLCGFELPIQK